MTVPRSAHDRFARYLLGSAPLARDFFHHYLPEELRNALALDSAELVEGSVVDEQLRQHHSDLLYRVEGLHGEPHWIYLLIEHKSHPDRTTPFQLLRYINRLWERLEGDPQHGLPVPIAPLLLYHGARPWPHGETLQAAWPLPEAFKPVSPNFRYLLCDLSRFDDTQIRGDIVLQIGLRLLKHIHDPALGPQLPGLLGLLEQLGEKQTALEYLEVMLRYAVATGHGVTPEDVRQTIHRV
ncbi:MAG: Rpn family recombination-promoting nuclease/putative transposase, partial [Candidatus Competibacterales bacterium]